MYKLIDSSKVIFYKEKLKTLSIPEIITELSLLKSNLSDYEQIKNFYELLSFLVDFYNDNKLDLSIAENTSFQEHDNFGTNNKNILKKILLRTNDRATKMACLINFYFKYDDFLSEKEELYPLLNDKELAICLLSNPRLVEEQIKNISEIILEKYDPHSHWQEYLVYLLKNTGEQLYKDGYSNSSHFGPVPSGVEYLWDLLYTLPITEGGLYLLNNFLIKTAIIPEENVRDIKFSYHYKNDVESWDKLFERWKGETKDIDLKDNTDSFFALRANLSQAMVKSWITHDKKDYFKNHNDLAVRIGYYRSAKISTEEFKIFFDKDGIHFFQALIDGMNRSLYASKTHWDAFCAINPNFSEDAKQYLLNRKLTHNERTHSEGYLNGYYEKEGSYSEDELSTVFNSTNLHDEWSEKQYAKLFPEEHDLTVEQKNESEYVIQQLSEKLNVIIDEKIKYLARSIRQLIFYIFLIYIVVKVIGYLFTK